MLKEDLYAFRSCIDQYLADKGHYPSSIDDLVDEGYLRRIPVDPMTKSADTWVEIYAEADEEAEEDLMPPDDMGGGPGVIDVRSGAEGVGEDEQAVLRVVSGTAPPKLASRWWRSRWRWLSWRS